MRQLLIITALLFSISSSFAQERHWKDQILSQINGQKVVNWEQSSANEQMWFVTVKHKKNKGLYMVEVCNDFTMDGEGDSTYVCNIITAIQPDYINISSFTIVESEKIDAEYVPFSEVEIATLTTKKKVGIAYRRNDYDYEFIEPTLFFDKVDWSYSPGLQVAVFNNRKWGIYDWYHQGMIAECTYTSIEDFPKTNNPKGLDPYTMEILTAFNNQKNVEKVDLIDLDNENGDGLFKARSETSEKWGLYQYLGDEIVEAIPMKYDSLYHFPWNGNYTAVFNDGKIGFYLSYWSYNTDAKQTVPCIYDDYKRYITDDQIPKLAVQKDGKWGWVDWLTGEEKSEFKYDTPDDLPYPLYKQEM
jgi:hypothetical protein